MKCIETLDLHYTFPDGTNALNGVNFLAQKGERVAILGANGAGKSTLFYCLNGLYKPTHGKVFVNGEEVTKSNLERIRQKIGLVFQDPDDQLFAPTVSQDIAFGPRNLGLSEEEISRRVEETMQMLDIYNLKDKPPHNLSQGQKRRAAIAGVLAMDSEILVLDEPTSNLDPRGLEDMITILDELNREYDTTLIISSHSMDVMAEWAEKVFVLHKGEILDSGSPQRIFDDEELVKNAGLKMPTTVRAFRDFEARGIVSKKDTGIDVPLTVLDLVDNVESDVSIRYAIADKDVSPAERMGLLLKDGVIFAVSPSHPKATVLGNAVYPGRKGDDIILITPHGGIKNPGFGRISVLKIPSMTHGGTRALDLPKLKDEIDEINPKRIGAMGTAAKVALRKTGLSCNYDVDVVHASISAALRGMDVAILASGKMADHVVKKIDENNLKIGRKINCVLVEVLR
ncbi:MAG: energy-coupling factor ABC transporter ATP-binding protein [Candidatus Hydrothermarchaeales archaeon]